jgi:hypothetical protein
MRRLDSAFATVPTGGGISAYLDSMGRRLLARAIASGDVSGTVEAFRSYIEKNAAPMIAVIAVAGVRAAREVRLGQDIRLVPITSLSPSVQRGQALGQLLPSHFVQPAVRQAASSALVTALDYGPIFYWPNEGGVPSATAQQGATSALQQLNEARLLLSLLGISAVMTMFWVQPKDPLMSAGVNVGWLSSNEPVSPKEDAEIDVEAAEGLASAYFRMDPTRRQETLHIPLDRLDRASRNNDLADRSIDLGIALEALLLHELEGRDRGELRFRLSLRGAWLGGNDTQSCRMLERQPAKPISAEQSQHYLFVHQTRNHLLQPALEASCHCSLHSSPSSRRDPQFSWRVSPKSDQLRRA